MQRAPLPGWIGVPRRRLPAQRAAPGHGLRRGPGRSRAPRGPRARGRRRRLPLRGAGRPAGRTRGAGALAAALLGLALVGLRRRARRAAPARGAVVTGTVVAASVIATLLATGCDVDPYCLTCGDDAVDAGPIDLGPVDLGVDFAVPDLGVDLGAEDAGPDGCTPGAPERCNGIDDNCDGNVDEGIDVTSDPNNCGACGMRCEIPRAFAGCVDAACTLDECDVGFYDLDGIASNGCEYRCIPTETNDAVCDLRDNDCDGEIDEDVDFQTDPINCGACARTCRFARAVAGCTAGACVLSGCDAGFFDLDGLATNGCEYACTPADPAVESCNGRDDDCDGDVDEGDPGGGATCGTNTGACSEGTLRCTAGALVCNGEVAATTETCNGIDDDCDGDVDDGDPDAGASCGNGTGACERGREVCTGGALVCTGGIGPVAEICNGIDDDCNGLIDDGSPGGGVACGPSTGACTAGMTQCVGGVVLCQGAIGPTDETCNGADDDCDGATDEGNPGGGSACGTDVGECNPGTQQCVGGALTCVGATPAATETCNGLDDDCDAMIDDGVASAGSCGTATGECAAGTLQCLGGAFQCVGAVGPALEVCNTRDDDCDGATDEGFTLTTDLRNCGACGNVCSFANAIAGCSAGACALVACNTGFFNRNGLPSDGCEVACDFAGAEVCNGRDDDCDGATDEGLTPPANFCNPNGVCAGTAATCTGAGGWVCNYPATYEPTETRCDALDNDCDGVANEGFPLLGTTCANGVGECRRAGTFVCNAAQTAAVCNAAAAGAPSVETCNNRDDDCDGSIDESIALAEHPHRARPAPHGRGLRERHALRGLARRRDRDLGGHRLAPRLRDAGRAPVDHRHLDGRERGVLRAQRERHVQRRRGLAPLRGRRLGGRVRGPRLRLADQLLQLVVRRGRDVPHLLVGALQRRRVRQRVRDRGGPGRPLHHGIAHLRHVLHGVDGLGGGPDLRPQRQREGVDEHRPARLLGRPLHPRRQLQQRRGRPYLPVRLPRRGRQLRLPEHRLPLLQLRVIAAPRFVRARPRSPHFSPVSPASVL